MLRRLGLTGMVMLMAIGIIFAQSCPINPAKNRIEFAHNLIDVHSKLYHLEHGTDSNFVVVHIGDSHIQLDHFTGAIRANMHKVFGDCGEGVLFPYSACKSFGPRNLESKAVGKWICNTVCNNTLCDELGVTGYTLRTTDPSATLSFKYLTPGMMLDTPIVEPKSIRTVTVWHGNGDFPLAVDCKDCGAMKLWTDPKPAANGLRTTKITNYIAGQELKLKLKPGADSTGQFRFHGISFDVPQSPGIQYHHCGVVGAQFPYFVKNAKLAIAQLVALKPDLIVFSYGSNESYMPNFDAVQYAAGIESVMKTLRQEIKGLNFVFTTTPDTRAGNKTPPHTKAINQNLRKLAERAGAALWDLNAIMGGDNSVRYWVAHQLARTDKLHFTRAGYKLMGDLFALAFLESYNRQWDEKDLPTDSIIKEIATVVTTHGLNAPYAAAADQYLTPEQQRKIKGIPDPPVKKPLEPFKTKTVFHEVAKGETLYSIAKKYGETVEQIRKFNGMTEASVLKSGTRIVVKRVE
jgi:LysM repeat protein